MIRRSNLHSEDSRHWTRWLVSVSAWAAACGLAVLPFAVAADFGGVLHWTQYVTALVVVALLTIAFPAFLVQGKVNCIRQYALLIPLLAWLGYASLQVVRLPPSVVKTLSPASFEAYTDWIEGLVHTSNQPDSFPISISVYDSTHAVAFLALLIPIAFVSATVFTTRTRLAMLMSAVALGGASLAAFGIARKLYPGADFFDFTQGNIGRPFGTFINRNNAALMLNFGMAASLGLLAWRLTALTGQEVDDEHFEFNDLFALVSERESAIGIVCAILCVTGLLACGSRSGLIAAMAGGLLAFGWVRRRRGFLSIPVVATAIAVATAILVIPFNLDLDSIQRFEIFNRESSVLLNEQRFNHWPEGLAAGIAHLPAGSGLATYGFAYLPFQESGTASWCEHADNLWLELFVEQGIGGLLLALAVLWTFVRSLNALCDSPDALDQGVQTMGWYCIGCIAISQLFDFGLVIPANAFLITIIVAAIVAHQIYVGNFSETDEERRTLLAERLTSWTTAPKLNRIGAVAIPVVVLGLTAATIPKLKWDAQVESLVFTARTQLTTNATNQSALRSLTTDLAAKADTLPHPELLRALANVEYALARIDEVEAAGPMNVDEARRLYQSTGPSKRRLVAALNRESADPIELRLASLHQSGSDDNYHSALHHYQKVLTSRPLDRHARAGLVYLDFTDDNRERTHRSLSQLRELYNNNPKLLVQLGAFAAASDRRELALELWKSALKMDYRLTKSVLSMVDDYDDIRLVNVIPDDPATNRIAARESLREPTDESVEFLDKAIDAIECQKCETHSARAACLELGGDIAAALNHEDSAFELYREAIDFAPANANLRDKLIRRLYESGNRDGARKQARIGRANNPSDPRFDQWIDRIVEAEIADVQNAEVQRRSRGESGE